MYVEIYFNLHHRVFSVRALEGPHRGRVVAHAAAVTLTDAAFVVQPAGRARVLAEGRKNVHAFVRGHWGAVPAECVGAPRSVTYNPYRDASFVALPDRTPVRSAAVVEAVARHGAPRVLAWG